MKDRQRERQIIRITERDGDEKDRQRETQREREIKGE